MDLQERIARRRSARQGRRIVVDRDQLSPVVHRPEPVGRGPCWSNCSTRSSRSSTELPPPVAIVGPAGSGTSAVVTAMFDALNDQFGGSSRAIETTTRGGRTEPVTWFVTVDGRQVESPSRSTERCCRGSHRNGFPESGVGTDDLRDRLSDRLSRPDRRAVVAIDHHDARDARGRSRPRTAGTGRGLRHRRGRTDRTRRSPGETVTVPAYRDHELVDVVTDRVSTGLAAGALDHGAVRELADWADGNAHDALAALFGAAVLASEDEADRIESPTSRQRGPTCPTTACTSLERSRFRPPGNGCCSRSSISIRVTARSASCERYRRPVVTNRRNGHAIPLRARGSRRHRTGSVVVPGHNSGRQPSTVEPRYPTIAFRSLTTVSLDDAP